MKRITILYDVFTGSVIKKINTIELISFIIASLILAYSREELIPLINSNTDYEWFSSVQFGFMSLFTILAIIKLWVSESPLVTKSTWKKELIQCSPRGYKIINERAVADLVVFFIQLICELLITTLILIFMSGIRISAILLLFAFNKLSYITVCILLCFFLGRKLSPSGLNNTYIIMLIFFLLLSSIELMIRLIGSPGTYYVENSTVTTTFLICFNGIGTAFWCTSIVCLVYALINSIKKENLYDR